MAPKKGKKGKKKSPAELEAERLALEEQMRLEEEERERIAEEERKRLEAEEAERQRLKKEHLDAETELLTQEREELAALFSQHAAELAKAEQDRLQSRDWDKFTECTPLPDVVDSRALQNFVRLARAKEDTAVQDCLVSCEDILKVIKECEDVKLVSQQLKKEDLAEEMHGCLLELQSIITKRIDSATAHLLQHSDMYAVESSEPTNVQVTSSSQNFKAGVWVNTSKNPRLKFADMSDIDVHLELPKSITLASVALRVQTRPFDDLFFSCTNEFAAVGGMVVVDLLALPPVCKSVKSWTLRQVTPLSKNVQRLSYPIPPAGQDPATYVPTEEPPPLGITCKLEPNLCFLDQNVRVGWWDARKSCWSEEGISEIKHDSEENKLTFQSTKLAPLAVIQSRTRLLPYQGWHIRPCAGEQGGEAILSLDVGLEHAIEFHVLEKSVKLLGPTPSFECFNDLLKTKFSPRALLAKLMERGMFLMPEDRDAEFAKVTVKKLEVEEAMCNDISKLADSFLVASCKWNQLANDDEAIVRLHEVIDWEAGGRTEAKHVHRIFSKEKDDGPRKVIAIIQRGTKGCAFANCLEKELEYQQLPEYTTPEYKDTIYGECHASVLTLLRGTVNDKFQGTEVAAKLCATEESINRGRTVNPCFANTMAQLMIALRLLSFG